MRTVNNVALYPRLSSADFKGGKLIDESRSITNQKAMMTDYCNKRGWNIREVYDNDDGVSGTTFDRIGFMRMMSDVEQGLIDCVIIIDLSRFGRNYVEAGFYRNKLKESGVRYIAINDNYDSNNDIGQAMNIEVPIKEIFNEYYPAQVSQKVRAVKRMMSEQGKFCNSRAPYGYQKSAEDRHKLVIDENVSHNVERIYSLYISGITAREIADTFNREGIPTPNTYYYDSIGKPNPRAESGSWGFKCNHVDCQKPCFLRCYEQLQAFGSFL